MSKKKQRNMSEDAAHFSEILSNKTPFAYKEAFKALRTNLSFASMSGKHKKIIITSAIPNEGKSTVAINLAATLADAGSKVILLDCDLRNPSIHRYLRTESRQVNGLTSVLAGTNSLEDQVVMRHPMLKFDFISAGFVPPNPAELLNSPMMRDLLKALEFKYDYIICDAPPVGVVTDAAVLSKYCDGVLLVVRQKYSTKEQIHQAKQNLDKVQAKILGAVFSRYNMAEDIDGMSRYGYGYGYGVE